MKQDSEESDVRFVTKGGANHLIYRLRGVLRAGFGVIRRKTLTFVFYVNGDDASGSDADAQGVRPAADAAVLRIGLFCASGGVNERFILFAAISAQV
jgi:hypothetical protein